MTILQYLKGYSKMKNRILLIIFTVISLILIDQTTKYVLQYNYKEPIGNDIISIVFIENDGVAFGLNAGNTKNIILTVLILCLIINFIRNQKDKIDEKTSFALSLILAGGISNLIDRIVNGGVIDFIKIKNFAIFNIADCYIVIGWFLLVIFLIIFGFSKNELEEKIARNIKNTRR